MLGLYVVVRDIKREISFLDEILFSCKFLGRDITDSEQLIFSGMVCAYNRLYLLIKDFFPSEDF